MLYTNEGKRACELDGLSYYYEGDEVVFVALEAKARVTIKKIDMSITKTFKRFNEYIELGLSDGFQAQNHFGDSDPKVIYPLADAFGTRVKFRVVMYLAGNYWDSGAQALARSRGWTPMQVN